ncbi:MAG: hypothetical protein JJ863_38370 [Deltaproteobacteria bacterium]|nr:hypothetical protein [Deltaproteobacteria bacterium]
MTFDRVCGFLLASIWLLLASTTSAQPGGEFERTIREALAEFEAGHWIEARTLFLRAHEIRPSAEALRMAGNSSYEARDYVRAVELLESSLVADPGLREDRAELARQALTAAGRFVTRLTIVAPAGTRVRVDHAERDTAEPIVLTRGEHQIEASRPGFDTRRERVTLRSPERSLTLELRPSVSPEEPPADPDPVVLPPESESQTPPEERSLTWLWVSLGVVALVGIGVVAVTLGTRDDGSPLGADAPGRVIHALEFGR